MMKISRICTITFFLFFLIVAGCDYRTISDQLAEIDSLVMGEHNDSAWRLICAIDSSRIASEKDRSNYNLLLSQTTYLVGKPLPSDSLLDAAITYYWQNPDDGKLADCYYYKAIGAYKSGDYRKNILYLKDAEQLAEHTRNTRLRYKIDVAISYANSRNGSQELAVQYARKALALASETHRKDRMAEAYNRLGLAFLKLGKEDSALCYFDKITPYIKYIKEEDLPYFLSNLSLVYLDRNPEKSKELLIKSLSYEELSGTLEQLAEIYYDEGNKAEAYSLWKKALTINDLVPKDNIIHNLLEYDIEQGRTEEVCERVNEIIAIKDSLINSLRNDTIRDLQTRFDHQVELNAANERLIFWQWALGVAILMMAILAGITVRNRFKSRMQKKERQLQISNFLSQLSSLEAQKAQAEAQLVNLKEEGTQKILELERQIANAKQEIQELISQRKNWTETELVKVRKGIMLYEEVMADKCVRSWPDENYEAFMAYYDAINHEVLEKIEREFEGLTIQNVFYLLLTDMGKTKDRQKLSLLLGISKDSLRSVEHRIKKKRR